MRPRMLALPRTLALGRLAAPVLALALTGAPGLAELHAPEAEHRCTCRTVAGVHECACARCHAAAARASEERSPPCHRAAPGTPAPPKRDVRLPCWTGSCGSPDPVTASPLALEAFTVPEAAALPAPRPSGRVTCPAAEGHELSRSPEPPPPRAA